MVAAPDWGVALAAYQAALKLHQATHGTKPCSDPGLASFPKIMADEALMHHFMQRWSAATNLLHLENNKVAACRCLVQPLLQDPAHKSLRIFCPLTTAVAA